MIFIIPARLNSKRFPGKALYNIAGKSLIHWVYESTASCGERYQTYVATDSEDIFKEIRKIGGNVVMTSSHHSTGTDRVAEAARILNLDSDEIVINVQGDQPYIPSSLPEDLTDVLNISNSFLMATPVINRELTKEELRNPNVVKAVLHTDKIDIGYFYRGITPEMYPNFVLSKLCKHVGIYAFKNRFLQTFTSLSKTKNEETLKLEQIRVLDHRYRIASVLLDDDIHDINIPEDIPVVEKWLRSK